MAQIYLLDTNICIYFTKGSKSVLKKFESVGLSGCRISEITVAELLYGAENSVNRERNLAMFKMFLRDMEVLPISPCLLAFASEKARLRKLGQPLPDFDLLTALRQSAMRRRSRRHCHPSRPHAGHQQHQALPAHPKNPFGGLDAVVVRTLSRARFCAIGKRCDGYSSFADGQEKARTEPGSRNP